MELFGLIGFPLHHSYSAKLFTKKFSSEGIDARFHLFELPDLSGFRTLISENKSLKGLSVTIPYKEQIISLLDEVDEMVEEIRSVNCITINRTGKQIRTKGYNTDVYGFEESLKPLLKSYHKKALILGTGGSSKSVAAVLDKIGIEYLFVSRNPHGCKHIRYEALNREIVHEYKLIINTTPLGMYPEVEYFPEIPYEKITPDHLLFDLVYNPEITMFLKKGKENGARIRNGLEMLHLQAEKAWEIWNS